MQARREAARVMRLHFGERDLRIGGESLEPQQRVTVDDERARREPPLDLEMFEIACDVRGMNHASGSKRFSPALASSPMRCRNSVPMSAL